VPGKLRKESFLAAAGPARSEVKRAKESKRGSTSFSGSAASGLFLAAPTPTCHPEPGAAQRSGSSRIFGRTGEGSAPLR
jgi:hypothetical protein